MKVLFVLHHPTYGGPHNQAAQLAPALEERGWRTVVAITDEAGNARERLRAHGTDGITMPLHRLRARISPLAQARFLADIVNDVRRLRTLIRRHQIDLVQVYDLNLQGALAARFEGFRSFGSCWAPSCRSPRAQC